MKINFKKASPSLIRCINPETHEIRILMKFRMKNILTIVALSFTVILNAQWIKDTSCNKKAKIAANQAIEYAFNLEYMAAFGAANSALFAIAMLSNNDETLANKLIEFRKAHFKTVIALNLNKKQHLFTGIIKGEIIRTKKGDQGFGYDPIFQPNNYNCTFAEISMEEKSEISHRGIATRKLIEFLSK